MNHYCKNCNVETAYRRVRFARCSGVIILLLLLLIIIIIIIIIIIAVPLSLVRVACARNPTLAFCDSHILGDPIKPTSKLPVGTPKPAPHLNKASAGGVSEEEQQFLTWLSEQKDEVPDVDTDEFETGHRKHANTADYCTKYKVNYGSYCVNSNIEKLEGVLPQFCAIYSHHCGGDAGEFPKPKPLLEEKMEKSDTKAPPPSPSEAPVGAGADTSFNGPVAKYCQKFSAQYQQFCESEQRAAFGKADEFCMSYRDSCKPPSSSKAPAPMSDSAGGSSAGVSDVAKEIEDIDLPESGEDTGTEAPSSETEEKPSTKSSSAIFE
ncbi:unnamed protein product [Heligmosomoides polygyrus]|uniref:Actin cytoskeleton-regulatory complex protein PAN1 n=1 Tax=Heligmosomoides polygyrus TaxID=6339 RepID=A0A3P8FAV3_HELPZ|nr:unnamed protein product [Heligmosomoides polygyrus]